MTIYYDGYIIIIFSENTNKLGLSIETITNQAHGSRRGLFGHTHSNGQADDFLEDICERH